MFCELYELVALANILQCDIQSVYPYIDYRAEMRIMNAVYKPTDTSVPSNGRIIIFWSSTEDEISTRARPGNCGIWNPNHFVPLVRQSSGVRIRSKERVSSTSEVKCKTICIEPIHEQSNNLTESTKSDCQKQSSNAHTKPRVLTS